MKNLSFSRIDSVDFAGERSRPGCSSARPRAEHERAETHQMVWKYRAQKWVARARPTAPEAGALPIQTESFRLSRALKKHWAFGQAIAWMLLLGSAPDLRGQAVDVTATLDTNSLSAGGSTVLRVFARVTPGLQANADRIFSWYVDVLNTNASTATVNFAAMLKPTSDQSPQTSSTGTPDGASRRGIYDTFLNLPGAGVNAPVELMAIPVTALTPGQARFQIRPGTGANQSADFLVAPLGGGAALTGGNYALAEAVLSVSGTVSAVPLSITVTNATGGAKSVTLSFPVIAGFNYTAQYRDQLNEGTGWQPLPGAPHNAGRAVDLSSAGRRFYRIAVTPAN